MEETTFIQVDVDAILGIKVVYHRKTKVMYGVAYGQYTRGNMTVLVNPDGTPMIWEGE